MATRRVRHWGWVALALAAGWWRPVDLAAQEAAAEFANPPLLYEGPDPTEKYFVPAAWLADDWAELLPLPGGDVLQPPFEARDQAYYELPGSLLGAPIECLTEPACRRPTEFKDGFFQKLAFSWGYIDRRHFDDYGLHEANLSLTVAVPLPRRDWPLLITPTFNTLLIDGPAAPDLPARLYESYVDLMWVPRFNTRWTAILAVAPAYYGDFQQNDADAWRLTGKALIRLDAVPDKLQLVAGVLYLNRDDIRLLPAGGAIWRPDDWRHYELIFPRPKLSHRLVCRPTYEDWLYLAGEFGGNTWSIERGTISDKVTLRDFRVLLGLERRRNGGAGCRLEVGYVFGRQAEFASGIPSIFPDDTAIVRAGVIF